MGKKNKNKKKNQFDYYNMTAEEQKANAELFSDYEEGEASFLDALNYKVPSAPISQSSFTKQIEAACLSMNTNKTNETEEVEENNDESNNYYFNELDSVISNNHVESHDTDDVIEDDTDEDVDNDDIENNNIYYCDDLVPDNNINDEETDEEEDVDDKVEDTKRSIDIPMIHCRYNNMTGRIIIDDEAIATPVSLICTSTIEIDKEMIPTDPDEYSTIINSIFYYIISCKHPSAILSEDAFEIKFGIFKYINSNRVIFFRQNGFVYVYILDEDMRDTFFDIADVVNMDEDRFIRYVVGAAYAANTMHNTFMHDDEDEVESVMEERHNINDIIEYIESNFEVDHVGHDNSGDVFTRLHVMNIDTFVPAIRTKLDDLLMADDDEDDEEETEDDGSSYDYSRVDHSAIEELEEFDDYDDDDIDVDDYPDNEDLATNTDNIDQMMENIESTEDIINSKKSNDSTVEKVATNESHNNMTVKIHRR